MYNKTKELVVEGLTNMRDNIESLEAGLCRLNGINFKKDENTYWAVDDYIDNNKPLIRKVLSPTSCYYWPKGRVAPRLKWLNYHINKLSK